MSGCVIGSQCYLDTTGINMEDKTVPVILSDETKVLRFGWEEGIYELTLAHTPEAVDLTRKEILPVLLQHNTAMLPIGIWEDVRLEDGKLKANARFDSEDTLAMEVFGKIARGFMQTFSVGITVLDKVLSRVTETGTNEYTATKWQITEASVVTVPAIPTARVGMSDESATMPTATTSVKIASNSQKGTPMEFNQTNFEALLAEKAGFAEKLEALKATVADGTVALEAKTAEVEALKADMGALEQKVVADKEEMATRVREAVTCGVDAETAVEMLSAENSDKASLIALKAKQSNGGTHQADTNPEGESAVLAYAKANKGRIK